MAGSFVVNNGDVTVTFAYTVATAKGQAVIDNVVEELFERGMNGDWPVDQDGELIEPADLTYNQRVTIVDVYVKRVLVNMAQARDRSEREEVARQEAQTASDNINLE